MSKGINILISEKYNFVNKKTNYYNSAELDYYKSDAFNQPKNSSDVYYIQDPEEYKYWDCGSQFLFNNKIYFHLQGNYDKLLDNFKLQKRHDKAYAFSNVTYLVANLKNMESKKLQYTSIKDIPIIYSQLIYS